MKRLLLALMLIVPAGLAFGEEPAKPKQGNFVVMVGVGAFADEAIQPRPTAEADAAALHGLFTDPKFGAVAADRAVLLSTAGDRKPTRENIVQALREAVAKTGKDDLIVLGLFGRGAPVGEKTAIFAADSSVKERATDAVLGSDIAAELKGIKNQKLLVLMDVSFKGFDAGKEALIEPTLRDVFMAVFGGVEDQDDEPVVTDKLLILSARPMQAPLAVGDHGLLAAGVLDALKGKADREGYGPDGLVTADELTEYLEKEAAAMARSIGTTTVEKETVPFFAGEQTSHFPITRNPAFTATVEKRLEALATLEKSGDLPKNAFDEGVSLVNRMPKLKALQELRRKYEELADGKLTIAEFLKAREAIKESMLLGSDAAAKFAKCTMDGIEVLCAKYVKPLNVGEMTAHAIRGLYKRLEQPLPEEFEQELKSAKDWDEWRCREMLAKARLKLGKREDLDGVKDVDLALLMMSVALNDPYTVYLDKEAVKKAESGMKSQFSGIGIHIRRDLARDGLLCVAPIKGSPAYKAGLKAGDLIIEVRREVDAEGQPITDEADKVISTRGMKMDDALKLILGKPGVPVTVVVEREGADKPIPFEIRRGRVSLETVLGVKRDERDDWDYIIDPDTKIAYIYLTQFGPRTAEELKAAVAQLQRQGMKGLVLDLRFNPGGMLGAALFISDMFIDDGLIVTIRPRIGDPERYYDRRFGRFTDFPMAVLINGNSASASEIVSACLQDYGRAVVIGERTYGKGSVQTIEKFSPTEGEFKFTTARYYPPQGRNIDKQSTGGKPEDEWGVLPNEGYEIKLSREERLKLAEYFRDKELLKAPEVKEGDEPLVDRQLEKALDYLRKQIADGAVGAAKRK